MKTLKHSDEFDEKKRDNNKRKKNTPKLGSLL